MTPLEIIVVGSVGGGIGAWLRIVMRDECTIRGIPSWKAILWINLMGGALAGLVIQFPHNDFVGAAISLGFLGGLTTFSSMCVDAVTQWLAGRRRTSCLIAVTTMLGGPALAWLGSITAITAPKVGGAAASSVIVATNEIGRRRMRHHLSGLMSITLGASVGSAVRIGAHLYAVSVGVPTWTGTAMVNVVGAAAAGFTYRWLCALHANGEPLHPPSRRLMAERFLIFGFAGGLTTMSSLAVELQTATQESLWVGLMIGVINIGFGLTGCILGWRVAVRFFPKREPLDSNESNSAPQGTGGRT